MNEREEFAEDLAAAGGDFLDLANAIHARKGSGDAWFGALGFLVLQLAELVAGRTGRIRLLPEEMKTAVRAYTNVSRTFRVLRGAKRDLIPLKDWEKLEPFGYMINNIWDQVPGRRAVRDNLPEIIKPTHPAWRKEKPSGQEDQG